jgi:hypothetical protein
MVRSPRPRPAFADPTLFPHTHGRTRARMHTPAHAYARTHAHTRARPLARGACVTHPMLRTRRGWVLFAGAHTAPRPGGRTSQVVRRCLKERWRGATTRTARCSGAKPAATHARHSRCAPVDPCMRSADDACRSLAPHRSLTPSSASAVPSCPPSLPLTALSSRARSPSQHARACAQPGSVHACAARVAPPGRQPSSPARRPSRSSLPFAAASCELGAALSRRAASAGTSNGWSSAASWTRRSCSISRCGNRLGRARCSPRAARLLRAATASVRPVASAQHSAARSAAAVGRWYVSGT